MKTTKTTKTTETVMTPKATITPAVRLANFEADLGYSIQSMRREMAKMAAENTAEFQTIAKEIEESKDAAAAYRYLQSYWGMDNASETAGKLKVYADSVAFLDSLKAEHESPADLMAAFLEYITETSLGDTSRGERSSNHISLAMSQSAGEGRGRAYRDISRMAAFSLKQMRNLD
jgi:hypothetical protein